MASGFCSFFLPTLHRNCDNQGTSLSESFTSSETSWKYTWWLLVGNVGVCLDGKFNIVIFIISEILKAIFNQTWKWIHSEKEFKGWCKIQPSKWTKNKILEFLLLFFLVFNLWYMIPPWILFFIQDETTTWKTCDHTNGRDTLFTFKSLRLLALHLKACKIYQAQLCTIFSFSVFY